MADQAEVTTTPLVVYEAFPAVVRTPDGTELRDAKVAVTADADRRPADLYVWVARGGLAVREVCSPVLVAESRFPPRYAPRAPWKVATGMGVYSVTPGGGCGCGHPLRRWTPWTPWRVGAPLT